MVKNALAAMDPEKAGLVIEKLVEWAYGDEKVWAFCVALVRAVTQRGKAIRIEQKDLCDQLTALYLDVLQHITSSPTCNISEITKVSAPDLTKYLQGGKENRFRLFPIIFLIWLHEKRQENSSLLAKGSDLHNLLSVRNLLEELEAHIRVDDKRSTRGRRQPTDARSDLLRSEAAVAEGIKDLFGLQSIDTEEVLDDFFVGDESKAHFLVYRLSVKEGHILKGFLELEAPKREGMACNFTHFYKDRNESFRETRGLVLSLRRAHYLVGGVGESKYVKTYNENESRQRPPIRDGMKCVVIESESNTLGRHVWSGLFLSHATAWEPIAGRCVLVRARHDNYQKCKIGVQDIETLNDDLMEFGTISLEEYPNLTDRLADAIHDMIDNKDEDEGWASGPLKPKRWKF